MDGFTIPCPELSMDPLPFQGKALAAQPAVKAFQDLTYLVHPAFLPTAPFTTPDAFSCRFSVLVVP